MLGPGSEQCHCPRRPRNRLLRERRAIPMPAARSNSGDDSARSPVLVTGTSDQPNFRLGDSGLQQRSLGLQLVASQPQSPVRQQLYRPGSYTWSHCVDNGSFASSLEEFAQLQTDRYNPRYDYGQCTFDIRQNFVANALYTLPFKGNRLVEGWRFSTILGIHSGLPLNVYNSGTNFSDPADLGTQWGSRANYSYAPGCSPNHILDKAVPGSPGTIQWFDTSCYVAQAPGFLGNVQRDSLPVPAPSARTSPSQRRPS